MLVEKIGSAANFYKVGMELYAAAGMEIVSQLSSFGKKIFLDLKLYDIGETVKRTTRQICRDGVVTFLTVHGSRPIMNAAVEGRAEAGADRQMKLLGVTVLTSLDEDDVREEGYSIRLSELLEIRVKTALEAGVDGVICSPLDVHRVRETAGPNLLLVTPGVRSRGAATDDQKRIATPAEAIRAGADYLVIGRQVTRAADPKAACEEILAEIAEEKGDAALASRL